MPFWGRRLPNRGGGGTVSAGDAVGAGDTVRALPALGWGSRSCRGLTGMGSRAGSCRGFSVLLPLKPAVIFTCSSLAEKDTTYEGKIK